MITRFDTIHERDRQMDGQADGRTSRWTDKHDSIGLAYAEHLMA